jgi:hypothetical protein
MEETPSDILVKYGNLFAEAFRKSLLKHDKFVSGNLSQSIISMPLKVMGQKLVVEIRADEYFKFVNEGVDGWNRKVGSPYSFKKAGKRIPLQSMRDFMAMRGIQPAMNIKRNKTIEKLKSKKLKKSLKADSKEKDLNSAAFAIGYAVKKKGIRPTHFADEVIESSLRLEMEKELSKSVGRLIKVEIKKATNGSNN